MIIEAGQVAVVTGAAQGLGRALAGQSIGRVMRQRQLRGGCCVVRSRGR
jgi:NAD(P)-dependent dehydrogenase (short-subunit alcohol dehydrogenase family)